MLINNPEHLNQNGCNINTTVFLEISVLGQSTLALPLRMGGFRIVYGTNDVYVPFDLQPCNIFIKSSAGTSVSYETFPGIYSANCCNTHRIVVKSKTAV